MIDISQWRVAIGLWNCCQVLICCSSTLKGGCTLSNCFILSISLIILITFLIVLSGDVELNPGPPKQCELSMHKYTDAVYVIVITHYYNKFQHYLHLHYIISVLATVI